MTLIIKDFEKQKKVSKNDIVSTIDILPKAHLKWLTHIVFDPSGFYRRSYAQPKINTSNILGEYQQVPTFYICINRFRSLDEFQHVLIHEVGHHVYQQFLKPIERKKWLLLHRKFDGFVSDYARTNAEEDFAESYAAYWLKNVRLERFTSKKRFFVALGIS